MDVVVTITHRDPARLSLNGITGANLGRFAKRSVDSRALCGHRYPASFGLLGFSHGSLLAERPTYIGKRPSCGDERHRSSIACPVVAQFCTCKRPRSELPLGPKQGITGHEIASSKYTVLKGKC